MAVRSSGASRPTQQAPSKDGRQARWEEHNRQRRQQIIDAALAVVADLPPGAEFHVQQIADRAGLNRTVVYRHFADRSDLDRAIQVEILTDIASRLVPEVNLDGTVERIIGRSVSTYVEWVVAHPSLHAFADQSSGPFEDGIAQVAATLVEVLETAIDLLHVELSDDERDSVEPLAYGLVGAVLGAVRRWITRDRLAPSAERLAALLSESVWHLLDGHARRLGLDIDPHLSLEELLSAVPAQQT